MMEINVNNYNYGFALLRIWMCFEVVCCHFWEGSSKGLLRILDYSRDMAVPCFALLSSYLLFEKLDGIELGQYRIFLGKRIRRLLYPQIVWTLILGLAYKCVNLVSISGIIWQLLTGHKYNTPMWFQVDLIVLTLIMICIFRMTNNSTYSRYIIMFLLFCISFIFQYTELLFSEISRLREEISFPLGRMIEMIPYIITGYFILRVENNRKLKKIVCLISVVFLFFYYWKHLVYIWRPNGFNTQGVMLYFGSVALFVLLKNLPLRIKHLKMKCILIQLSKCTMGVYFIHMGIGKLIYRYIITDSLNQYTLTSSIMVFLISMMLAFIFSKINNKYVKNLFV